MSITDRDKKILVVLAALAVLAGYWLVLLSPKREEVALVEGQIATQQQQRDAALSQVQAARTAQASFESDYAEMVRLGKAIPSNVDMPSLLVQLDRAADGTHIDVEKITVGARAPAAGAAAAPAPPPAQGEAAGQTDTQTSENARDGSVPVGGGSTGEAQSGAAPAASGAAGVAGLESVPIEFGFTGSYFDLADFFHRLKRFVHVGENGIVVRGRLMTIDSFTFGAAGGGEGAAAAAPGDELQATLKATVYLAPEAEGTTAGATPAGPAPQPAQAASTPSAPPTAAVQP